MNPPQGTGLDVTGYTTDGSQVDPGQGQTPESTPDPQAPQPQVSDPGQQQQTTDPGQQTENPLKPFMNEQGQIDVNGLGTYLAEQGRKHQATVDYITRKAEEDKKLYMQTGTVPQEQIQQTPRPNTAETLQKILELGEDYGGVNTRADYEKQAQVMEVVVTHVLNNVLNQRFQEAQKQQQFTDKQSKERFETVTTKHFNDRLEFLSTQNPGMDIMGEAIGSFLRTNPDFQRRSEEARTGVKAFSIPEADETIMKAYNEIKTKMGMMNQGTTPFPATGNINTGNYDPSQVALKQAAVNTQRNSQFAPVNTNNGQVQTTDPWDFLGQDNGWEN